MSTGRRQIPPARAGMPAAAVALVIAIAIASAIVWVRFAGAPQASDEADPPGWPVLAAVPTR